MSLDTGRRPPLKRSYEYEASDIEHWCFCQKILQLGRYPKLKPSSDVSEYQTRLDRTGLPGWPFDGQFRKIWPFLKCAGHEKTQLAIL